METKETNQTPVEQETQVQNFTETLDDNERRLQEADARIDRAKDIVTNNSGVVMTEKEVADSEKNPEAYRVEHR